MPLQAPALSQPLTLRSGATLKNRLVKSAMSEALGTRRAAPTRDLVNLYDRWSRSGAALLITGNVMVDSTALGEPGNVAVEDDRHLPLLRQWAQAGTANDTHLWMQINHPGKQAPRSTTSARIATAGAWRTACGSWWRSTTPSGLPWAQNSPWA